MSDENDSKPLPEKQVTTPGPWTFQPDDTFSSLGDLRIVGADRISPAIVFGGIAETSANARLIAAAPDLLAALQLLLISSVSPEVRYAEPEPNACYEDSVLRANDAIAKALGIKAEGEARHG